MLRLLSWLFCVFPERVAFGVGRAVGWIWFHLVPVRRGVALRNIERALGDELDAQRRREIIARSFQHQALFGVEALRFPLLNREESERLVERVGFEHMQAGVDE
ncbi:MAG: hypothetical protein AAF219_03105, partial [Myxococcota bacterium]